jgi:hypothetical protein
MNPQQAVITGVGYEADVNVPERLVTQHGLTGIKTGVMGIPLTQGRREKYTTVAITSVSSNRRIQSCPTKPPS